MKMLLEENETLTQIVSHAGRFHQSYKPKFSLKNPAKNQYKPSDLKYS